jgi:hypothetical protein
MGVHGEGGMAETVQRGLAVGQGGGGGDEAHGCDARRR